MFGIAAIAASGCAHGVTGAGIGHVVGGAAGLIAPPLAPVGAILGYVMGASVDQWLANTPEAKAREADRQRQERQLLDQQMVGGFGPAGGQPGEPVRVWIDETLHDGRLVAGHFGSQTLL